jgi:hypothetical protein
MYYNNSAGNPNAWTYVPDLNRQAYFDRLWENGSLRLTWQVSARNKVNLFWDEQAICRKCTGANPQSFLPSSTTSAEAVGRGDSYPLRVQQASWTSTATNRVLVEFGFGTLLNRWGGREPEGNVGHDLILVTEQCTAGCAANGNIPGLTYRSTNWASNWNGAHTWRGSVSYVTLREKRVQRHVRPGDPRRLGSEAFRLEPLGLRSPTGPPSRVTGNWIFPALVQRLHGHRQPSGHGRRLHDVQRRCADRFTAARRRRQHHRWPV